MHITIYCGNYDSHREFFEINVKDGPTLSFCDGEPEDNSLGRNFNDWYAIMDLVKLAYAAGKNGVDLDIVHKEKQNEDWKDD